MLDRGKRNIHGKIAIARKLLDDVQEKHSQWHVKDPPRER
jgi:hypothetical protein